MEIISHVYPDGHKESKEVFNHPNQKFPIGTEVYIVPITDTSMLHFECDVITMVRHTYGQMHGDNTYGHESYSTNAGTWYDEHQLVATNGRDINQCRCDLIIGGESYADRMLKRKSLINNDPLNKIIKSRIDEAMKSLADDFTEFMKKNKESK